MLIFTHKNLTSKLIPIIVPELLAISERLYRGGLFLKMGRLDDAHIDLENVVRKEPTNEDANRCGYKLVEKKVRWSVLHSRTWSNIVSVWAYQWLQTWWCHAAAVTVTNLVSGEIGRGFGEEVGCRDSLASIGACNGFPNRCGANFLSATRLIV